MIQEASPGKSRPHLDYVDGLRALCALWVVGGHALQDSEKMSHPGQVLTRFLGYDRFGVTTFIVISGFCLAIPAIRNEWRLRDGVGSFLRRRAGRILPPYYFAMFLSLLLTATVIGTRDGTLWDLCVPVTHRDVFTHLLLIQNFDHPSTINHVFWSIAVEWQIYFLFPLLIFGFARWGAGRCLALLLVTLPATFGLLWASNGALWAVPLHFIWLFAAGMFAAQVCFDDRLPAWLPGLALGLMTIAGFTWLAVMAFTSTYLKCKSAVPLLDVLAGVAAAALLAALGTGRLPFMRRLLQTRTLVWIGTFSYSIYLMHAPLLAAGVRLFVRPTHLSPPLQFAIMLLGIAPLVVGLAWVFFYFCERPFLTPALRRHEEEMKSVRLPGPLAG